MIDKNRALQILHEALKNSSADQTEAVLMGEQTFLTRFAESTITQNIAREETTLVITAVNEKKIGIASTNNLTPEGIKNAAALAGQISLLQAPDDGFVSFPDPTVAPKLEKTSAAAPNLDYTPADMAAVIADVVAMASGLSVSGAFRHDINTVAVANSLGVEQYGCCGKGELSLTVVGEGEQSGYGITFHPDPALIDYRAAAQRAIDKARRNLNPVTLPDGQYTVVLEAPAVGQLLLFLSFLGFGGKTVSQKRSFLSSKTGELITGANITIRDEASLPDFGDLLFDYEGVPTRPIVPIDQGKAGEAAYDSYYANLAGIAPTGHAVQPNNAFGPYPKHLSIAPGDKTLDEIIASVERGILITHFWYINYLNPMQTMITGTTLDGTFLIENGRLGPAIKNMRTNQSILEAFAQVEILSKERIIYPQYSSLMLVPAMKINNFNLVQETKEEWEGKC